MYNLLNTLNAALIEVYNVYKFIYRYKMTGCSVKQCKSRNDGGKKGDKEKIPFYYLPVDNEELKQVG